MADVAARFMKAGWKFHQAIFKALDSLGIKDLDERITTSTAIRAEFQRRSAETKKAKTKSVPDYFFL